MNQRECHSLNCTIVLPHEDKANEHVQIRLQALVQCEVLLLS